MVGGPPTVLRGSRLPHRGRLAGDWDLAVRETEIAMSVARRAGIVRGTARAMAMRALMLAQQGHAADAATAVVEAGPRCSTSGVTPTWPPLWPWPRPTSPSRQEKSPGPAAEAATGGPCRLTVDPPAAGGWASFRRWPATRPQPGRRRSGCGRADDADPYVGAMVDCVLAKAAEIDSDPLAATGHMASAVEGFDSVGARFEASRSRITLAAVCGDPEPAKLALAEIRVDGRHPLGRSSPQHPAPARRADRTPEASDLQRAVGPRVGSSPPRRPGFDHRRDRPPAGDQPSHRVHPPSAHLPTAGRVVRAALTKRMLETGLL